MWFAIPSRVVCVQQRSGSKEARTESDVSGVLTMSPDA